MYPGLAFHSRFAWDPLYYRDYVPYWKRIPLPTQQMINEALPEGVLGDDGRLEGFLYFQPVDPDELQVAFRAELVDAESGETFDTASISFTVSKK